MPYTKEQEINRRNMIRTIRGYYDESEIPRRKPLPVPPQQPTSPTLKPVSSHIDSITDPTVRGLVRLCVVSFQIMLAIGAVYALWTAFTQT